MPEVIGPTTAIVWMQDPDGTWHRKPCDGCEDYCELASIDEDHKELGEIYQQEECCGQSWIRQVAVWRVTYEVRVGGRGPQYVEGYGIDCASAMGKADAELARLLLLESPHGHAE